MKHVYLCCLFLIVLVLGASNIRLIIENWMKYGLLIKLPHSYVPIKDYGFFFLAWLCVPLSLLVSLVVEFGMGKLAVLAKDAKPDFLKKLAMLERVLVFTHCSHLIFLLTFPSYLVYTRIYHPLGKAIVFLLLLLLSYPFFFLISWLSGYLYLLGYLFEIDFFCSCQ